MQTVLINLGHIPIIEEFIPEEEKEPIPFEEIKKKYTVKQCCIFVSHRRDYTNRVHSKLGDV